MDATVDSPSKCVFAFFCRRTLPLLVALSFFPTLAHGQIPFYWDDFERESVYEDAPTNWRDPRDSEITIQDGSVIFRPLADTYPGLLAQSSSPYADASLRTKIRFLDVDSCSNNPWVALLIRDALDGEVNQYWAGPATNGQVFIGESVRDNGTIRGSSREYDCDALQNQDLHMQLDAIGEDITFTSWLDGEEKPDAPQLSMTDDSNPFGEFSGIFINPSASLSGFAIRYMALMPAIDGDFDGTAQLGVGDLDLLIAALQTDASNRVFDLDKSASDDGGQPVVDLADVTTWLSQAATHNGFSESYLAGDTNLDGSVDAQDLNALASNWNQAASAWTAGDFNGDGQVDSLDLNEIGLHWQRSIAAADVDVVPEPRQGSPLLVACLLTCFVRRKRVGSRQTASDSEC